MNIIRNYTSDFIAKIVKNKAIVIFFIFLITKLASQTVSIQLKYDNPNEYVLNYPKWPVSAINDVYIIEFTDTTEKISFNEKTNKSLVIHNNKDMLQTLNYSDFDMFGWQRVSINLHNHFPLRRTFNISKSFNRNILYREVSEIYTGHAEIDGNKILIGVFIDPNKYKYNSEKLFIVVNENNDAVFDSYEIQSLQYPVKIGDYTFEFSGFSIKNENVFIELEYLNDMDSTYYGVLPGQRHPDVTLFDVRGKEKIQLSSYFGCLIIIDYWFAACSPCIKMIPTLNTFIEKYPEIQFLAVNPVDDENTIINFLAKVPFNSKQFYIAFDESRLLNVNSMPHSTVISKDGRVIAQLYPTKTKLEELIKEHINQ